MNLRILFKKMIIIGVGFIGLEFVGIYSLFGVEVIILNFNNGILLNEDVEDLEEIIKLFVKRNVKIVNNVNIKEIKEVFELVIVEYEVDGKFKELISNMIFVVIGRKVNIEGLGLENVGIELNERGFIKVLEIFKINKEYIWVIGDINGGL